GLITSRVATIEVRRAVSRVVTIGPEHEAVLSATWMGSHIVELDESLAEAAARIGPSLLRSLDAVHLATAISVTEEAGDFVTYDRRLADAARSLGLSVVAPA
ncbi:MAG TPA: type II toxin-antitoxin system VapC family toxin, partial [Candidatus Limnocylindria bacterium]|nr:type II toxin-antitoxin system VapC family toxin [Candidatus Limnocylindria bacterium]